MDASTVLVHKEKERTTTETHFSSATAIREPENK